MRDVRSLIDNRPEDDVYRVHRSAMTDPEILELERRAIFDHCWLYLGHESEVPRPGDFVRRTVSGRPLFFIHGVDGEIRVFLNSCPHRGALICREDAGNTNRFQCFYHAWTFDSLGDLVNVPRPEAYGDNWSAADHGLMPAPRVSSYRGLLFVAFTDDLPPLEDYLAPIRPFLDTTLNQADEWRILPGSNDYYIGANWKLMPENTLDLYHTAPLHKTFFNYAQSFEYQEVEEGPYRGPNDLGNGHSVAEYPGKSARPIARWSSMFGEEAKEDIAAIRARIDAEFDADEAFRMTQCSRLMFIFPNLMINDISAVTIRAVEPVAVDEMEVRAWAIGPRDEDEAAVARRVDGYTAFIGPGGLASPDDVEALESCQQGYATIRELEWSDVSRGVGQEPALYDETPVRAIWNEWHRRLVAHAGATPADDRQGA